MDDSVKPTKRAYHAPRREAAAARTREAIMAAAKDVFERLGWSGATMRGVSKQAQVSLKTVEALYGTKAALLKAVVDYAIAGDVQPVPIIQRESVSAMEAATDASAMLDLHARHVRSINERAAAVAWVVEQAAPINEEVAKLWAQMSDNRRFGANWAATTLLKKQGVPSHIELGYAEDVFWLAIDFATYRSLTVGRGFSPSDFERWIRDFYDKMLLH